MPEKVSTSWPRLALHIPGLGLGDIWPDTARATRRREERGRLHNYFGALYLWGGIDYPDHGPSFFAQAEIVLQKAARLLDWYQPHENLGDTYRFWSRSYRHDAMRRLLLRALASYGEAERAASQLKNKDVRGRVLRRVAIARATAMLLTEDAGLAREALGIASKVETGWNELDELDIPTVYNAASFHSLRRRINPSRSAADRKAAGDRALWLLTVALLRKGEEYGEYLARDEDFRDLPGIEELRESTLLKRQQTPSVVGSAKLSSEVVSETLEQAKHWREIRRRGVDMDERSEIEQRVHEVRDTLEGIEEELREKRRPDAASKHSVQRMAKKLDAMARSLRDIAMSMPGSGPPPGGGADEDDA